MPELVADCPRCGSRKMTFDVAEENLVVIRGEGQHLYESFCICRNCRKATIFNLSQKMGTAYDPKRRGGPKSISGSLNRLFQIEGYVAIKDCAAIKPPEYLPEDIATVFMEGATCHTVGCYNAAAAMFRLCVDLATRKMLPEGEVEGLNAKTRRDLGLRLPWLFEKNRLPIELKDLSDCIKEEGNDGAHAGSLKKEDGEELVDFTVALLERIYTEPERLRIAKERRIARRKI